MAIINCKDCGKVCVANLSEQCAECRQKTWQAEVKVAEYLEAHQNSTLEEIHQATGVQRHIIMQMIRTGHISEGSVSYPCANCQAPISEGRLCAKCVGQVLKHFEPREQAAPEAERRSGEMYTRQIVMNKV
jgi:hypothetical protein